MPLLAWLFSAHQFNSELIMIMAVATSLATIVPTAIVAVSSHHRKRAVVWRRVAKLTPGIIVGAAIGALFADWVSDGILRVMFVVYLLYVAGMMVMQVRPVFTLHLRLSWLDYLAGGVIGMISSLLGIGGGTMTVPYLLGQRLEMKNAVAVSSACGLPIAVAGTLSYAWLGWEHAVVPDGSLGYVYLPAFFGIVASSVLTAPLGVKLAHQLPAQRLKRYFAIILFIMAVKMMV
nr:sulfite exporter TauE/SafE family protein [Methylomarinum sp. Ch1-1]MDP4522460.1 sulfite exporter TauE/SafE family protein [Methylomarinum sp. Ch1-1]